MPNMPRTGQGTFIRSSLIIDTACMYPLLGCIYMDIIIGYDMTWETQSIENPRIQFF